MTSAIASQIHAIAESRRRVDIYEFLSEIADVLKAIDASPLGADIVLPELITELRAFIRRIE